MGAARGAGHAEHRPLATRAVSSALMFVVRSSGVPSMAMRY
jgi:hypothetical protein